MYIAIIQSNKPLCSLYEWSLLFVKCFGIPAFFRLVNFGLAMPRDGRVCIREGKDLGRVSCNTTHFLKQAKWNICFKQINTK